MIIMHLDFKIDFEVMKIWLSQNKHDRTIKVIIILMYKNSITIKQIDELFDFLSYYYQVISLNWSFLYISFSFHRIVERWYRFSRIYISSKVKRDLRWWNILLENWSSHFIASREWYIYEIWIDVNGKKKIEDWNKFELFYIQILSHHRKKHINFKEMFIVLHVFILWHE